MTDDVILLAAISQLKDQALGWYNQQPLSTVATWSEFKDQIRKYFEKKETYTVTLSRINARTWRAHNEKFIEYAEAKLTLMQPLPLSEKEKIVLLAVGVRDPIVRKLVLGTKTDSIPKFLNMVRRITEDSTLYRRIEPSNKSRLQVQSERPRVNPPGVKTCFTCKQTGHLSRECKTPMSCFKCKQPGHLSSACPSRKESGGATLNHVRRAPEMPTETTTEKRTSTEDMHINQVQMKTESDIKIYRLRDKKKTIQALIDTGSPVNLLKKSIYDKLYSVEELLRVNDRLGYTGINSSPLITFGKVCDQIVLNLQENVWYDVTFLVVNDKTMKYDAIIGREFLNNSNLRLIYFKDSFSFEEGDRKTDWSSDVLIINAVVKRTSTTCLQKVWT
ncbi:hypothetical protein KPH14_012854 [Odynerus spinipes]|uniref:CCHC-type domain-containing protein n=1 Tax=Odynerus spinipes TaxID=1348599 RepID=A0AAD9RE32_9HYME|nr:hypothetical protein KPH14_012854 [Odynerus spinipes]